jgi:O-antigen ligase
MDIKQNIIDFYKARLSNIESWQWYLMLVFTASMMFSIALAQISVGIMTALWLVKLTTRHDAKFVRTALDIPYLAFVSARLLSILFSSHLEVSLDALYKEILFYIVFFLFTNTIDVTNNKRMITLLRLLFVCAVIAAVYGTAKYLLGYADRASSSTGGYYTLGVFLLAVTSLVLVLGQNKSFFPKRSLWIIGCLLCTIGIFFTFNRIHWIAISLIIIAISIIWQRRILYVFLVLIGIMLVDPTIRIRMYETIFLFSHMSERDVLWKTALNLSVQHPLFGFGPRTFEVIFPNFDVLLDKGIRSWHNDYLEIFMESGLIGLGAYIWLLVSVFKNGLRCFKSSFGNTYNHTLITAVLFGISGFLISGMAGAFVTGPLTALLFREFLAIAALLGINKQNIDLNK